MAASIFDVLVAGMLIRGYGNAVFITIFGVAGVFAGLLGYVVAMEKAPKDDRVVSIGVIVMQVIIGLLFFFPIATLEGGEYRVPFKAFGLMTALTSLVFFGKWKDMAK